MLCKATRSDGQPCEKPAIRGGEVCATHGGSTRHIKRAASRRVAEAEAQDAARRQLVKRARIKDPLAELRELADAARAQRLELEGQMARRRPEEAAMLMPSWGAVVKLEAERLVDLLKYDPRTQEQAATSEQALLARLQKRAVSPTFVAEVLGLLEQAGGLPEVEFPAALALTAPQADVAEAPAVESAATPEPPTRTDEPPRPSERVVPLPLPARAVTYERMGPFARPVTDPLSGLWPCPACGHESAGGASACIGCGQPRERYEPA